MLNTISGLLRKAKDNLHGARLLASEGLLDIAVGRAFFAMLYVAEAFLLSEKLAVLEPGDVVEAFGQRFGHTGQLPGIFHRWLIDAARLRTTAERETDTGITAETVAEQLERARAFVSLGREELPDAPE